MRPILPLANSTNQSAPSEPAVIWNGLFESPDATGNSVKDWAPVGMGLDTSATSVTARASPIIRTAADRLVLTMLPPAQRSCMLYTSGKRNCSTNRYMPLRGPLGLARDDAQRGE